MAIFGFFLGLILLLILGFPYFVYVSHVRKVKLSLSGRLVMSVGLGLAQIDLIALALAYAHLLYPSLWIGINVIVFSVLFLHVRRRAHETMAETDASFSLMRLFGWNYWRNSSQGRQLLIEMKRAWVLIAICIVLTGAGLFKAICIPETSTDALEYHVLQSGMMLVDHTFPKAPIDSIPLHVECYPFMGNLHQAWWMQLPGGMDLNRAGSFFMFLFGALVVYAFSRRLGARRIHALLLVTCYMATPLVFSQATCGMVDLQAVVAVTAAFVLLPRRKEDLLATAIAAGLLVGIGFGTRPNMLAAVPIVAGAHLINAAILLRLDLTQRLSRGALIKALLLLVLLPLGVMSMTIGSHSYIRNLIHYDNPLYPNDLKLPFLYLKGPHTADINAAGSYLAHLDKDFARRTQYRQLWSTMRDENNYFWYPAFWTGFSPDWWGNLMLWGLLPAICFCLIFHRKRWLIAGLLIGGFIFIAAIPFAKALPRFHALSIFMIMPCLALTGTLLDRRGRRWPTMAYSCFLVACIVFPNAFGNIASNFYTNYLVSERAKLIDPSAFRAEESCVMALYHRKKNQDVLVGPVLPSLRNQYFYVFQEVSPEDGHITWKMKEPFTKVEPMLRSKPSDLVLCGRDTDWDQGLQNPEMDYFLLWESEKVRLFEHRSSTNVRDS